MLKRTISAAVFVIIVTTFFLLREYVDFRFFDLLIWFLISVGTIELARALKPFLLQKMDILWIVFGILFVPHYALFEYVLYCGYGWLFSLALVFVFVVVSAIYGAIQKIGFKKFAINSLGFVYPALLILTMLLCNDFSEQKGFISMLLIFVISPCADTFAYLVGSTFSKILKGNAKKMSPKLSPKKTWAGAIGGVVGGVVGCLLVYLIFKPDFNLEYPVLLFIIVGIIASVADEMGDLVESYIKRKADIKDMGKIMPGHGGVMDRIDGMIFVALIVFLTFVFVL